MTTMLATLGSDDPATGTPVDAGSRYGARVSLRGIALPTFLQLDWYDLHGGYLSSTQGTPVVPEIADWNTEADVFGVAPAGAWWALTTLGVQNIPTGGGVMYVNGLMVSKVPSATAMLPYQPSRDIRVTVAADRINEARNPKFGADLVNWGNAASYDVTVTGASISRVTTDTPPPLDTPLACQVVATAAGQGLWTWCPNLLGGALHSATAWVKVISGIGSVRMVLRDTVNSLAATSATTSSTSWTALEAQEVTGPAATAAQVSLIASGAVTFLVGAVTVERGDYGPYFDGNLATPTADYMWEGPQDNSRSHFYRNRTIRSYRFRQLLPRFVPAGATATLLFAQPYSSTDPTYPGPNTFPNYDTYPQG